MFQIWQVVVITQKHDRHSSTTFSLHVGLPVPSQQVPVED